MQNETDVLVIGSGFAGLGMGIRLRQAGLTDFILLEQAAAVGGTWRDNDYPGVACDVPSHLYSFSFEANPRWSRLFAPQREILDYLNHCVDKYGVRPHIRFNNEVTRARFDERRSLWEVSTANGATYRARVLIAGTGGLSRPTIPELAGAERFAGKTFHTARWDHGYALEGQRVAVIGTGASAIQVVPAIAPKVAELVLFQRTPPWVLPKPDLAIGAAQQVWLARFPWLQRALRYLLYWMMESRALVTTNMSARMQRNMERAARDHLETAVADPVLRAALTPNYQLGCKRILISNDYYPALQRPNARVVTHGIAEIREHAIVTDDGREHAVDAIVYATGFQGAEATAPFAIYGRGDTELTQVWKDGPEAYFGTAVSGFPNLFMLVGPNTGLGHNSMVLMIESQIQYVLDALMQMRERALRWVEIEPGVQTSFNRDLHRRLADTVWSTGGCNSWYKTRSGKNTTLWPGFTFEYRLRLRRFDLQNYRSGSASTAPVRLQPSAALPAEPPAE